MTAELHHPIEVLCDPTVEFVAVLAADVDHLLQSTLRAGRKLGHR